MVARHRRRGRRRLAVVHGDGPGSGKGRPIGAQGARGPPTPLSGTSRARSSCASPTSVLTETAGMRAGSRTSLATSAGSRTAQPGRARPPVAAARASRQDGPRAARTRPRGRGHGVAGASASSSSTAPAAGQAHLWGSKHANRVGMGALQRLRAAGRRAAARRLHRRRVGVRAALRAGDRPEHAGGGPLRRAGLRARPARCGSTATRAVRADDVGLRGRATATASRGRRRRAPRQPRRRHLPRPRRRAGLLLQQRDRLAARPRARSATAAEPAGWRLVDELVAPGRAHFEYAQRETVSRASRCRSREPAPPFRARRRAHRRHACPARTCCSRPAAAGSPRARTRSLNLGAADRRRPAHVAENRDRVAALCGRRRAASPGPPGPRRRPCAGTRGRAGPGRARLRPRTARRRRWRAWRPIVFVADCLPVALAAPGRGGGAALRLARAGRAGSSPRACAALRELGGRGRDRGGDRPGAGRLLLRGRRGGPRGVRRLRRRRARRAQPRPQGDRARASCEAAGVDEVHDVGLCTMCSDPGLFFSHRRDGGVTGRQAGVAWRS